MMSKRNTSALDLQNSKTLTFATVIAGSLLIALSAQISVNLPLSPVPITGQTFGVLLVAALLGMRRGTAATLAYLGQGALGLPVFAGGAAGAHHLFGLTGGYLAGFVLAAALVGHLMDRGWKTSLSKSVLAMTAGTAVIFACGLAWMGTILATAGDFVGTDFFLNATLYPYLPGAVVKIAAAALVVFGMRKALNSPA